MSRRRLLFGAAAVGGLAALRPRFNSSAAGGPPPAGMPGPAQVWDGQQHLVQLGRRHTGSAGHAAFVDWLNQEFAAVPGMALHTDRLSFNRWLARAFSLSVSAPAWLGKSGPVPVTSYYPYSGKAPNGGVTGRLVDLGAYAPALPGTSGTGLGAAFWARARGGIALVPSAPSVSSLDVGQTAIGGYEPGTPSAQAAAAYEAYAALLQVPIFQGIFQPVPLLDARIAGVLGVICAWTVMPDEEVINQYNSFITPYPVALGRPGARRPRLSGTLGRRSEGQGAVAAGGQWRSQCTLTADITAGAATEAIWAA